LKQLSPKEVREKIKSRYTEKGGYRFTRAFLAEIGVPYPPPKGWRILLERGDPIPVSWNSTNEKWDGTHIVMIDTHYPEAIARWKRNSLPKAEKRFLRSLGKHRLL
jgi:hypothetical protein